MSPEQAKNWREFSRRMAWESHRWRTPARQRLAARVVDDMIECFIDDNGLDMIGSWDGNQITGSEGRVVQRYGRDHLEIAYPCDSFDQRLDNRGFSHWNERESCERYTDFASSIMCCIRAGFDVAVHPSAGVVGPRYTAGMIRRMFPEGLPDYVRAFLDPTYRPDLPAFDTLPDGMRVWL